MKREIKKERFLTLFEILYGLAIASGVSEVIPTLFGYNAAQCIQPLDAQWFFLLIASVIALFIGVGNAILFYQRVEQPWATRTQIFGDLMFPLIIFLFFAGAFHPCHFVGVAAVFCFLIVLTAAKSERCAAYVRFVAVLATAILVVLAHFTNFWAESIDWIVPMDRAALVVIAFLVAMAWVDILDTLSLTKPKPDPIEAIEKNIKRIRKNIKMILRRM